jgi:MoaA/NifB/PqqE/SkfB family radical SAM enzyme
VAKRIGFKGILFSGGGENLEEESANNFLNIARFAKENDFDVNLATNGVNINSSIIAELGHIVNSIRFSIPPNTDSYSHIGRIAGKILELSEYINTKYLDIKIYANVLLSPKMNLQDIKANILMMSQLGIDTIRFKAVHEYRNGEFYIDPEKYRMHLKLIHDMMHNKRYKLPNMVISQLEELIKNPDGPFPFDFCYYRDFNPLVVGCDAHNYTCCELKYEREPFDLGEISSDDANLEELCGLDTHAQKITNKCFRGCKGYLVNRDIQTLINNYRTLGSKIFLNPDNATIRDRVVSRLARTVISN